MARELSVGICEHCEKEFGYWLLHSGFGDCVYAYCDSCGTTAVLSMWDERMPKLPGCPGQREICTAMEPYIAACECGGNFKSGQAPRCPVCNQPLSAELATTYLERNAPGTKKGWCWQRNWRETYCVIIEEKWIKDNFRLMPVN